MEWPSLRRPIQTPKQLLVEGRTAEIFFREFTESLGLKEQVQVRGFGSLEDLTPYLEVFTGYKEFRESVSGLGIIRDAEDKPATAAFNSVCASLRASGLPCPEAMRRFTEASPHTGVFILPDCEAPGMLETLCWQALRAASGLAGQLDCVDAYLACVRQTGGEIRNEAKARVWSHLSAKGAFDPLVGRAAQAKTWDWQSPAFGPLREFLTSLRGQS